MYRTYLILSHKYMSIHSYLPNMLRWARRARVRIDNLLQYLRTQYKQHHLQWPHVVLLSVRVLRPAVEQLEQLVAAVGQLVVGPLLDLGELLGVVVHPVPDRLMRRIGWGRCKRGLCSCMIMLCQRLKKKPLRKGKYHIHVEVCLSAPFFFYFIIFL